MSRVAHVLPNLAGGGAERVVIELLRACKNANVKPVLFLEKCTGELLHLVPSGIEVVEIGSLSTFGNGFNTINRLRREIFKRQVRNVFFHLSSVARPAMRFRFLLGKYVNVFLVEHSILSNRLRDNAGRKWLEMLRINETRFLYSRADGIIAVSNSAKKDLVKNFKISEKSISVIYNPINKSDFTLPNSNDPGLEGMDAFLSLERPIITFAGRLHKVKGPDLCVRAFEIFARERKGTLAIFGAGPEESALKRMVLDMGLSNRVVFFGFTNQIACFLRKSDVFVSSSRVEGFGNVICEAIFAGLPIVATETDGASEIFDIANGGVLVRQGSDLELAKGIVLALSGERGGFGDVELLSELTDPVFVSKRYMELDSENPGTC